jgi:endogenous inhibitor of DNA gyrase (YacG/DUF329 family)
MKKVKCPTCQKEVAWDTNNPYRPFCSERCKLIDLGDWASESHRIPSNEPVSEEIFNQDKTKLD